MKRHAAASKQTKLALYFKKARADHVGDTEELPATTHNTAPSSSRPESQVRRNVTSDSPEPGCLCESPKKKSQEFARNDDHDFHVRQTNGGCETACDFHSTVNAVQSEEVPVDHCPREVSGATPTHSVSSDLGASTANSFDLGLFVRSTKSVLDPETKERLLVNPWTPPANYDYPATTKRNLKFQPHWVGRYPWLVYSENLQGALCKYCVVFADECAGKGEHQRLGCFVTKAFTNYKKATDALKSHAASSYHEKSTALSESFLAVRSGSQHDIMTQLDQGLKKQAEENRKNLLPIIETILFCGRQEVALRGTGDCGPITLPEVLPVINDGNFRALLRMRARCGDEALRTHIETSPANALYTSPKIQNELITLSGKIIQTKIVDRVNKASCFSVLADEATDISRTAHLSLCVRYVEIHASEQPILKEDFVDFVPIYDLTGKALASTILSSLRGHGFDLNLLCGQGYDGAASMSGHLNGVQAFIRQTVPKALYVHCSAHSLNLALLHSCKLPSIRNCLGTVSAVCAFVRASPQRTNRLQDEVENLTRERKSVLSFCQTRWVESHDALQRFLELYTPIVRFLEDFEEHGMSSDTSSKASQLLSAITKPEFVVSLQVSGDLFSLTLPLCKFLQKVECDLSEVCDHVKNVIDVLSMKQLRAETEFKKIFEKSCSLLQGADVVMALPRITGRQMQRSNAPAATPEEHYRRNVYLPLLAYFENQLRERFDAHKKVVVGLNMLLPKFCASASLSAIDDAVKFYLGEIPSASVIEAELTLWISKCCQIEENDRPACALQALSMCNRNFFPNIHSLLSILATLPVSTSTPERTFSTLRRLKSYLRNPMKQERLTGLALLSVHREIQVTPEEVLAAFCKLPRKKNFVV